MTIDLSFCIPARNEAKYITDTINAIHHTMRQDHGNHTYEILVGDHDSSDGTRDAAEDAGATRVIFQHPNLTIGAVRNNLARLAEGKTLVFLDADVRLREDWAPRLFGEPKGASDLRNIYGSYPQGTGTSWVGKHWFENLTRRHYIGSGHMLVDHKCFNKIGGFDERLRTGEDWDFCHRATNDFGVFCIKTDGLVAYHAREPETTSDFFWREVWHGIGDWRGLRPLSLLAGFCAFFTLVLIASFVLSLAGSYLGPALIPLLVLMLVVIVMHKFPELSWRSVYPVMWLSVVYMIARTVSVFYQGQGRVLEYG